MDAEWHARSVYGASGDGELAVSWGTNVLDAVQGENDRASEHAEVFGRSCERSAELQGRRL